MNKNKFVFILLLLLSAGVRAQQISSKPAINNSTYKTWAELKQYNISNNGKHAWYVYGTQSAPPALVICTTDGKYKREFPGGGNARFTADSKHLVFDAPEGFGILDLSKDSVQYPEHGQDFSMPEEGDGRWLAYHTDSAVVLKDMISGKVKSYPKATAAWFNKQGTTLILQTPATLLWVSTANGKQKTIMHGSPVNNITFDAAGSGITFATSSGKGNVIRYYQQRLDTATIRVTDNSPGINKGFVIADDAPQFSPDGGHIFFKLRADNTAPLIAQDTAVITNKIDVWNYKDQFLQSKQMNELPMLKYWKYTAAVPTVPGNVVQLESQDVNLTGQPGNKYALVSNVVDPNELHWNNNNIAGNWLISLQDGRRKSFPPDLHTIYMCQLSPGEQFVTWFDPAQKNYFSYEVATGVIRNVTIAIKTPIYNDEKYLPTHDSPLGAALWLAGDKGFLIYDRFDIWQVDPTNKKAPINITGSYGRINNITFRVTGDNSRSITSETVLLTALNKDNKYNGLWKKRLGNSAAPVTVAAMAPCLYYFPGTDLYGHAPIKAKNADVYLVQRSSAAEAPNLFALTSYALPIALSDIHPEKGYNWMTSELIHWKMPDGLTGEGILYKPENFDPAKKYPLIFYYYERRSNELFSFRKPDLSNGTLTLSWFVSNGYLVCIPNIYYIVGHTGQSVVNSVVSAAKYLSEFPWVDTTKMGLEGHSFGGYETNFLITHSNLFAAAQESAGVSDLTSWYGGISFGGISTAEQCETGHSNLHTTPWQQPGIYVENSPVFTLDKVRTPLLILHDKGDGAVPFSHGVAMFTGLRRLQKPVWMLQYDGQDHTLTDTKCRLDFSIRQQQFFDHYLKGAPMPVWMAKGISVKDKGIKSGLALSGQ